jgi:hypothetical protein
VGRFVAVTLEYEKVRVSVSPEEVAQVYEAELPEGATETLIADDRFFAMGLGSRIIAQWNWGQEIGQGHWETAIWEELVQRYISSVYDITQNGHVILLGSKLDYLRFDEESFDVEELEYLLSFYDIELNDSIIELLPYEQFEIDSADLTANNKAPMVWHIKDTDAYQAIIIQPNLRDPKLGIMRYRIYFSEGFILDWAHRTWDMTWTIDGAILDSIVRYEVPSLSRAEKNDIFHFILDVDETIRPEFVRFQ